MLTGELRSKIDGVWNAFWAGGIANPLEVIEQITYLLFMRGLDEAHTREENKATRLKKPIERRIFPEGKDKIGKGGGLPYEDMRWSRLKNRDPATMFEIVSEHVFPFLRNMAEADTAHATHMKGARFTIPTPALLAKVVDLLAEIPMDDRDTKGDLYEYMLSKIATAGQNGQFRTPRHIIALMVEMMAPGPKDVIVDPACGTCGFLVAAGEYLRGNHPKLFQEKESREHFHEEMFHGFDFDGTMLRIGSMNMTLHGVDNPDIRYKDSLSQEHADDEDRYSLVLANPPFAGALDYETIAKDLQAIVKTKKTELLFMALFLKLLKPGGRAAVIVPDGVLFGSSTAHREIRRMLVEDHQLNGIVKLPSGVFRPYAGVSTAIVLFTKTNSGGTDQVWFYDCQADGFSLDDKRAALLPAEKIGPRAKLGDEEQAKNNLPDIAARWKERYGAELKRSRTAQSFCVPAAEIMAAGYDLSINRYKEVPQETADHLPPKEIIKELRALERDIAKGLEQLEGHVVTWATAALGELCDIVSGATPKTSESKFWGGDVLWTTPKDLSDLDGPYLSRPPRTITEEGLKSCAASLLPRNSVLLSSRAPIGLVAINTVPMATNQGFKSLVPDSRRVDSKFLFHWLKSRTSFLQGLGNGATFKEISKAVVERIEIPLPPLEEQRRIATVLDDADALRRKRKRSLTLLNNLTQSIFLKMFGDPIEDRRYPANKLKDLVDSDRGISYGIVQRGEDLENGTKVLRISDIVDGYITGIGLKQTAPEIANKFRRTKLLGGEIVISIRGTVGRCAVVPSSLSGANVSREIAVIPTLLGQLNPFYLSLIRTDSVQRRLARDVKGVAQSGINLEDLRELPVIHPPQTEMTRFLVAQSRFDDIELRSREQSDKLELLFASLQSRAFSGQL